MGLPYNPGRLEKVRGFLRVDVFVNHGHQRTRDGGRFRVLNDVATVNDAGRALFDQSLGALQNLEVGNLSATAHEDRDLSGSLDNLVINAHIVGRVSLNDVGAELDSL